MSDAASPPPPYPATAAPAPQKSWFSRNCGCLIGVGIVVVVGGIVAFVLLIFFGVFGLLKKSEPYQTALQEAQTDPAVIEKIGEPIKAGFLVSGNVNLENSSGEADLSFSIEGPKGEGTVYVKGQKAAGAWSYDSMTFEAADGQRIELLETGGGGAGGVEQPQ